MTGRAGTAFTCAERTRLLQEAGFLPSCYPSLFTSSPEMVDGWQGEGLPFVYTSLPADVAEQREGAELGGEEADPPLPPCWTQPGRADGWLGG